MPFWLKSKALTWQHPERASSIHSRYLQVYARRRPGRKTIAVVLPGTSTETHCLESVVAYHRKSTADCIPEEILGTAWELLEGSSRCGKSSPCSRQTCLRPRARKIVATVEQLRSSVIAGKSSSAQYTMAESGDLHPTAGRRRREKGPPSTLSLAQGARPRLERVSDTESEHSEDSAGEKEAKRQRSEPTTPVSTSSRLPYEYDALMGITRVGTKEAEGFEEEVDTTEYHDAAEEPVRKEEIDDPQLEPRSMGFQGGYGSSSLKERIELLNATSSHTPAPLDSGVGQKSIDPPQVMSPSVEGPSTEADAQPSTQIFRNSWQPKNLDSMVFWATIWLPGFVF